MTRPVRFLQWRPIGLLAVLALAAFKCGSNAQQQQAPPPPASGVEVQPRNASLPPGQSGDFQALSDSTVLTSSVTWTASGGLITNTGVFTAPSQTGYYQIQATYAGVTGAATAAVVPPGDSGSPSSMYAAASSTCAAMPLRTTGTTHYFCDCAAGAQAGCVVGNDTNAGTSATAPKQTWPKVLSTFNSMNAGDTIALCQGGAWAVTASGTPINTKCAAATDMRTAANTTTCDVRDYAPSWGGTAKPLVLAPSTGTGYIFIFQSGTQRGVRIMNIDFRGPNHGPGGGSQIDWRGIVTQGENTDFLICNNTFDNLYIGVNIFPDYTPGPARIDIWGNLMINNILDAILGIANSSRIDSNHFDNNGSEETNSHTIYLNGQNITNVNAVNNEILRTGAPTACLGTMFVVHDEFDGLNIENNTVNGGSSPDGTCWGIEIDSGGYPRACWYRHLTVRRNFLQNVGYAPISIGQAPSPVIENNVIIGGTGGWLGIHVPGGQASRTSPADDQTTAAVVRNNTIYFPSGSTVASTALAIADQFLEGTNYVVANNAALYAGVGGTCMAFGLPVANYAYVDHNVCSGFQNWENTRTLAAWRTFSGGLFDENSSTSAPQFVNVASPPTGFKPNTGSPLIGAADPTQAPAFDFLLGSRPATPAIGAFEP